MKNDQLKELEKAAKKFYKDEKQKKKFRFGSNKEYVFVGKDYGKTSIQFCHPEFWTPKKDEAIFECRIEMKLIVKPYSWQTESGSVLKTGVNTESVRSSKKQKGILN